MGDAFLIQNIKDGSASGLPVIESGLILYLDAGNSESYPGSGTTWFDLSENNRNYTARNGNPQFTSNSTTSSFYMSSRGWDGPASNSFEIDASVGYTIFMVFKHRSSATGHGAFKWLGNTTNNRGIHSHANWNNSLFWDNFGDNAVGRTFGSNTSNNTWQIATYQNQGTIRKLRVNNNVIATNTNQSTMGTFLSNSMNLGWDESYGTVWNADLAAFVVYNRGLSDDEVTEVYNYFNTRFGF